MHTKRLTITYVALAAALLGLFALNLFWGSVAISPRGVVQALLGREQDELAANILLQLRLQRATCCKPFLPTPLRGRLSWAFPVGPSWWLR